MKKIAKQTVLFGALALLSSISLQAMETAPVAVQEEVAVKQGFFRGLTKDAREFKLKNLMKELDAGWKPFMRCVKKGGQDCSPKARTVRRILASIMALIGAGVLIAGGRKAARWAEERFIPVRTAEVGEFGTGWEGPVLTPEQRAAAKAYREKLEAEKAAAFVKELKVIAAKFAKEEAEKEAARVAEKEKPITGIHPEAFEKEEPKGREEGGMFVFD